MLIWNLAALLALTFLLGAIYYLHPGEELLFDDFQVTKLTVTARQIVAQACNMLNGRVLVTGAAGFIGYHASMELKRLNFTVVGLDNFNDYYPVSLKIGRSMMLRTHSIPVVRGDINDVQLLLDMFGACPFTHVLHLAAQPGVRYAARKPFAYVQSNVAGHVAILEAIRFQEPSPILVYASSSSVYGQSIRLPFTEDDRADVPSSLYAATKRSQELITHAYTHNYGITATGLRFFTVYGPWGRPDMSIMSFTRNIVTNKAVRVFLGPTNRTLSRDFTYIDDIVSGIVGSINSAIRGESKHRIFNLGNSNVVSVTQMIRVLEKTIGKKARVVFVKRPNAGEVLVTSANISAANLAFNFTPRTKLAQGVARFWNWYSNYTGYKTHTDMSRYVPDR